MRMRPFFAVTVWQIHPTWGELAVKLWPSQGPKNRPVLARKEPRFGFVGRAGFDADDPSLLTFRIGTDSETSDAEAVPEAKGFRLVPVSGPWSIIGQIRPGNRAANWLLTLYVRERATTAQQLRLAV